MIEMQLGDTNTFIKDNLQNIIDEVVALTYRLLYKLKFNK